MYKERYGGRGSVFREICVWVRLCVALVGVRTVTAGITIYISGLTGQLSFFSLRCACTCARRVVY